MRYMFAALIIMLLISGCTISGAKVKVKVPFVEIESIGIEVEGSRYHCPPGHAKKGWC